MPGKGPPACADGPQVLLPRALCSGTRPATTFPRLQAAVRANRVMDDPRFRWRGGEGSRPRVAPRIPARAPRTTRAETWRAVPPKTSGPAARPRRGLPRAAQAAGTGYFFVTSQVRPIQPARPAHKTHARSKPSRPRLNPARFANGRWPSRYEAQGCAADGTADSPELWRAATSAIMCE